MQIEPTGRPKQASRTTPEQRRQAELADFLHVTLTLAYGHLDHALDALEMGDQALLAFSLRAGAATFCASLETYADMKGSGTS